VPAIKSASNGASNAIDPVSIRSYDAVKQIDAGVLSIGYAEVGPADGKPVILLHGWPYDIHSYVDVASLLAPAGYRVLVPYLRGYGSTRFLSSSTPRNGDQAVFAVDTIAFMDALNIDKAIVGGFDWGGRAADVMAALWPGRCKGLVSVSGYQIINLQATQRPLSPQAELGWWYLYYFTTERGRRGYAQNLHDFNKLIWKLASPKWDFDDATYDRTARSYDNPDHVDLVIHNYRWRLGLAKGDPQYDDPSTRLQQNPIISIPTVTIGSDFDGAAANGAAYRDKFSGRYVHRTLNGIGHNVPQEDPHAFADAVITVDTLSSTPSLY
jgi:pimeloyl-ACP methyl ester carboxylesterase